MSGRNARALLFLAGALSLEGCSPAATRPTPDCHIADFLGDWVNGTRPDEGISVHAKVVTVMAGRAQTRIAFVTNRDFGPVTRQVLRQEFGNLTALGVLPTKQSELGEMRCALHLIRPQGAAALVLEGKGLVFLEETDGADPPAVMRLRRGKPKPGTPPDLSTPPT